jgi:hypothetical protein
MTLTLNLRVRFTIITAIYIISYTSAIVLNKFLNFIFQFPSKGHVSYITVFLYVILVHRIQQTKVHLTKKILVAGVALRYIISRLV